MTVWIVDDSPFIREMMERLLRVDQDIETRTFEDASSVVAYFVRGESAEPAPDLILMDLHMPGLNGIEACREIKRTAAGSETPLLVVTASEESVLLQEAFAAGASDFIKKPLDPVILRSRVRHGLRLRSELLQRKEKEARLLEAQMELSRMNLKLQHLATTDGLTGISNRRSFDERLDEEWRRARRDDSPLTLILLDIDEFKRYNDSYGHVAGDACLRGLASVLTDSVHRAADFVARYGGEEFAIILPDSRLEGALIVAESIAHRLRQLAIAHEMCGSGIVTVSMGIAELQPEQDTTELIRAADRELYRAKQEGRNRICWGGETLEIPPVPQSQPV